ncbi:unnamed protein product [Calypogeia fissa]
MRLHNLLIVARSAYYCRALHLIHQQQNPKLCVPHCKPFTALASSVCSPPSRARSFSARGGVKLLLDLKRNNHQQQPTVWRFRMSSVGMSSSAAQAQEGFQFGPYRISAEEVFLTTKLSFAFVNLRPVVPVRRLSLTVLAQILSPCIVLNLEMAEDGDDYY